MTSLTFPDINVWLALVTSEHVHHASASRWWEQESNRIGFSRLTQLGFLRLMTTAAALDGKPLAMAEAWRVHDMTASSTMTGLRLSPSRLASKRVFGNAPPAEPLRPSSGPMPGCKPLLSAPAARWSPLIAHSRPALEMQFCGVENPPVHVHRRAPSAGISRVGSIREIPRASASLGSAKAFV